MMVDTPFPSGTRQKIILFPNLIGVFYWLKNTPDARSPLDDAAQTEMFAVVQL